MSLEQERHADQLQHLRLYFEHQYEPDDVVEVRCLPSRASYWNAASEWLKVLDRVIDLNANLDNVYAGANPRAKHGVKSDENVVLARSLFVDWDGVGIEECLERLEKSGLPHPTMIVLSGGGVHAYWRLVDAITDLKVWRRMQYWLSGKLGSDRKVRNAERIMRLPGTVNKKPERNGAMCEVWEIDPDRRVESDLFGEEDEPDEKVKKEVVAADGVGIIPGPETAKVQNLSRATLTFLAGGASEGERNHKLFAAAADMCGVGYTVDAATDRLMAAALGCGLTESETRTTIKSAFGKSRTPAKPLLPEKLNDDDFMSRLANESGAAALLEKGTSTHLASKIETGTWMGAVTIEAGSDAQPGSAKVHSPDGPIERCVISNVHATTEKVGEKRVPLLTYKEPDRILNEILNYTGGWPRLVGDQMFYLVDDPKPFGPQYRIEFIKGPSALFAYLHQRCDIHWVGGDSKVMNRHTRASLSPIDKSEFYSFALANLQDRYTDISYLPHHEKMMGTFYVECRLPAATGEALKQFVEFFNAETELDRGLLTAALLTMGWGGPAGSRPAIMVEADQPGSGKTSTVRAITDVWGGAYSVQDPKQTWENVTKAWASSNQSNSRALLFDNVKSLVGGMSIEAAVTDKTISGWKSYVGTISRPNTVTVFVTVNGGRASEDMATRFVPVHMGKPKYGVPWLTQVNEFLKENRWAVIADCLQVLRGPDRCEVPTPDRFADWQRGVLTKFENGVELAAHITRGRGRIDGDVERASDLYEVLQAKYKDVWSGQMERRAVRKVGDIGGGVQGEQVLEGLVWVSPAELFAAAVDGGAWGVDRVSRDTFPDSMQLQMFMRFARQNLSRRGFFPIIEGVPERRMAVKVWNAPEQRKMAVVCRFAPVEGEDAGPVDAFSLMV